MNDELDAACAESVKKRMERGAVDSRIMVRAGWVADLRARAEAAEARIHGLEATVAQWRTLAGQLTERAEAVEAERGRLRVVLEKLLTAHDRYTPGMPSWTATIKELLDRAALSGQPASTAERARTMQPPSIEEARQAVGEMEQRLREADERNQREQRAGMRGLRDVIVGAGQPASDPRDALVAAAVAEWRNWQSGTSSKLGDDIARLHAAVAALLKERASV